MAVCTCSVWMVCSEPRPAKPTPPSPPPNPVQRLHRREAQPSPASPAHRISSAPPHPMHRTARTPSHTIARTHRIAPHRTKPVPRALGPYSSRRAQLLTSQRKRLPLFVPLLFACPHAWSRAATAEIPESLLAGATSKLWWWRRDHRASIAVSAGALARHQPIFFMLWLPSCLIG